MCSRIAARRESRACETDSSVAACSASASALLCCSSQLRTFGSASKVINSWICLGDASWLVDGFAAFKGVAAKPNEGEIAERITAKQIAAARIHSFGENGCGTKLKLARREKLLVFRAHRSILTTRFIVLAPCSEARYIKGLIPS